MNRDPYEVLGLTAESGPTEWKRAFRRLAMRWHPDRNDHPDATERFKEINSAYERLTTGERSATADEASETSATSAATPEADPPRAPDIRLNLELTLEEAASGCRKTINYHRGRTCTTCAGSGEAGLTRTRFCAACHGSGRVRDDGRALVPCPDCGGRGFFSQRICSGCGGTGREAIEFGLEITVPAGMMPGDELRLAGQGEAGEGASSPGDLYLTVVLRTHALYSRQGRDLHFAMPVSALAMMAGAVIELPALTGAVSWPLEPGAAVPREIRLAGKGYPGRGKNPAGDLVVELTPVFPAQLTPRQRKLLLSAHAALLDDAATTLPEIAAWRQANGLG